MSVALRSVRFQLRYRHTTTTIFRLFSAQVPLLNTKAGSRQTAGSERGGGGIPVSAVFTTLVAIGLGATTYGVYDFYSSFAIWPKELRGDLRAGIKAQHRGDPKLSQRYLQRAWETCIAIPEEKLGKDPWLKISGIACKLGEVLEDDNLPQKAYDVYAECCVLMQKRDDLSMLERHRAIALALHLGELSSVLLDKKDKEEEWLLWSVEEFIKIQKEGADDPALRHLEQPQVLELSLPAWTRKDEFEAALEALGSCYAKQGNNEYALSLYLRALTLILPSSSLEERNAVAPQRRCRAAEVMTSISNVLLNEQLSPERLAQAKAWTSKGLEIAEKARGELADSQATEPVCDRVLAVLLYNLGAILEMQDDREAAKEQFTQALKYSQEIGMQEGILEADDALARLKLYKTS